jgi:hypothetical protein
MSYGKHFRLSGLVTPVRAPTWILFIRIYLSIRAHNKFEMSDLFMGVIFFF